MTFVLYKSYFLSMENFPINIAYMLLLCYFLRFMNVRGLSLFAVLLMVKNINSS